MSDPPRQLDGAAVICWSLAPPGASYELHRSHPPAARAVAVCRYDDGGHVYLFACDADWEVVQDWDWGSVEEAIEMAAKYVRGQPIAWQRFGG